MKRSVWRWLVALMFLLAGCRTAARTEPTPTPVPTAVILPKPTYRVARGTVVDSLTFRARAVPARQVELAFKTVGRVKAVSRSGTVVKAGDLLAELDVDTLIYARQAAVERLEMAEAKLASAIRNNERAIARAEIDVAKRQIALDAARAQDPEPRRRQAEAELAKAQLTLERAQRDYDQVAWRSDVGMTPQAAALQAATIDVQRAQAAYDQALQSIQAYRFQIATLEKELEAARQELEWLRQGPDPLLTLEVTQARRALERVDQQIADARIVAPFDGEVEGVLVEVGKTVDPTSTILILSDPTQVEASAILQSTDLARLAEGMPATLESTTAAGRILTGTVRALPRPHGRGASAQGNDMTVRIAFGAPPEDIKPGDLLNTTITIERRENVLYLPPSAVRLYGERRFVVVVEGSAQRRVDVEIGLVGNDRVEILSGVEEGQEVLAP